MRLLVFGGTGDLMSRYLAPALVELEQRGRLPHGLQIVGIGREPWSDDALRAHLTRGLDACERDAGSARRRLLARVAYRQADATDEGDVRALVTEAHAAGPIVAYLALPPEVAADAVDVLARAGIPAETRLAIEKPFGEDLTSARAFNERIDRGFDDAQVFRVDHFLGMRAVRNLPALRFANPLLAGVWSADHIERVDIVWDEVLGLEGRAGYYDGVGALRDMVQNHLLVVTSMLAMEPPASLDPCDLRARRTELLREIHTMSPDEVRATTMRARYGVGYQDGTNNDAKILAYAAEDGVDPDRCTETFVQLTLHIDNDRWRGVPFVVRTGKALARDRHEVVVTLKQTAASPLYPGGAPPRLRIGLDPVCLGLELNVRGEQPGGLCPTELVSSLLAEEPLSAYARVLDSVFSGDAESSVGAREVEEGWRIVEPLLAAWRADQLPLHDYPAGSEGPEPPGPELERKPREQEAGHDSAPSPH